MRQCNNVTIKAKGVTLIEMLAAVAIFSIIIGAISGLFISGIQAQRRILATQELLDQVSYVLEYMGRAIRMARKDLDGTCIPAGSNFQQTSTRTIGSDTYDGPGIKFINSEGICQEFFRDDTDNRLKEWKSGYTKPLSLVAEAESVTIFNAQFVLSGEDQTDNLQPRATIFLGIGSARISQSPPMIQIQTSISQRSLDVQY